MKPENIERAKVLMRELDELDKKLEAVSEVDALDSVVFTFGVGSHTARDTAHCTALIQLYRSRLLEDRKALMRDIQTL